MPPACPDCGRSLPGPAGRGRVAVTCPDYPLVLLTIGAGDYAIVDGAFSREAGLLVIGADPQEWRAGYDTVQRALSEGEAVAPPWWPTARLPGCW